MYRARQVPASDLATATGPLKGSGVRLPQGWGNDNRLFTCFEWRRQQQQTQTQQWLRGCAWREGRYGSNL